MAKKVRTTLSLSGEILQLAHEKGLNISRFLENALRSYLEGNGSQQQPQSLEQPSQTPKELDLKSLLPDQVIQKLRAYGFDVNDNEWLRRIIRDSLNKTIVELGFEVWDKNSKRYVLF